MSYEPIPVDINGNVPVSLLQEADIFGNLVTASRVNQIEFPFIGTGILSDMLNLTVTGTGSNTFGGGTATFNTGTGATASSQGVTIPTTIYHPGAEVYSFFTAAFTTPTDAGSFQIIGLFDANNGFYIGYGNPSSSGLVFGVNVRSGGVDTFINRTAWNGDLLTGVGNSKFTRMGVPEAVNLTVHNVWRIRFGWLGSAPILFEILSPDGLWVIFHTIRQPNTSILPSIQTPNIPMTAIVSKTSSDATNLIISSSCFAAGTTAVINEVNDYVDHYWTSGASLNSTVMASTIGYGNCSYSAAVTGTITAGAISFEITPDGNTWYALGVVNTGGEPVEISTYELANGSGTWQMFVGGYYETRIRLSTVITGSGSVKIMLRPSLSGTEFVQTVYQPIGTNLHAVVDPSASVGNAPVAVSVGVATGVALAANTARKGAAFINTSSNYISFATGANAAILYSGITLNPNGGVWVMDQYTFTTGAINAIASGAASNLSVLEFQ